MIPALTLRPATAGDAAFIHSVIETTLRPYAEATWGAWSGERAWADARLYASHPNLRIIGYEAIDCGMFHFEPEAGRIWLQSLSIVPAFQNKGIGRRLVRGAIEHAGSVGLPLQLRVLRVDPAQAFYHALGCSVYQETAEFLYMQNCAPAGADQRTGDR